MQEISCLKASNDIFHVHVSLDWKLRSQEAMLLLPPVETQYEDSIKFQEGDKIVNKVNKLNYFIMCDPSINLLNDVISEPELSFA